MSFERDDLETGTAREIVPWNLATVKLVRKAVPPASVMVTLLEASRHPIFAVNADYCYLLYSRSHADVMCTLYGAEIEAGGSLLDYITVPEDRLATKLNLDRALSGEHVEEAATSIGGDGDHKQVDVSYVPIRSSEGPAQGVLVISNDVTESHRLAEDLHRSQSKLDRFFQTDMVGRIAGAADGKVVDANDYLLKLIGYTREELCRGEINWRSITPAEYLSLDEQAIATLKLTGECSPYEKEYQRRDGTRVSVLLTNILPHDPEDPIEALVIDITDRKRMEDSLQRLDTQLERERNSVSSKQSALREVLSHLEEERNRTVSCVSSNISSVVTPLIRQLRKSVANNPAQAQLVDQVSQALDDVMSPFVDALSARFATLSPRELQVCSLVKDGIQSKEIAGLLGISVLTVHTIRRNIRKKLALKDGSAVLSEYLNSIK